MTADERQSAALLLWPSDPSALDEETRAVLARSLRCRRTPMLPVRLAEALAARSGRLGWESDVVPQLVAARRATLGEGAAGEPRVLLRVDEFPHARGFDRGGRFGTDRFRRFHAVLAEAGIPYLLAISPRVSRDYLDPRVAESRGLDDAEIEQLRELARQGVAFGLHGLDHRTRRASPRRRSEFCGLSPAAAAERIDAARRSFDELELETRVFVPPFNRFDAAQYEMLAERFEIVCGGPESVRLLGFSRTPVWRRGAVYMPSYPPLYGRAAEVATGVERLSAGEAALWAPATLHWGWEVEDDFAGLRRLCRVLAGRTTSWPGFLEAVETSRSRSAIL